MTVALPLIDSYQRRVSYVRLSLTDRCNFRCTYCMPEQGVDLVPKSEILSFEEIERLIGIFAQLGVERVRLTGGEPTVRKDIVEIAGRVAHVPGIREVMMTTNGLRLEELARPLAEAGLSRINISLDTLDRRKFAQIARRDELARVLAGIEAACAAGFSAVKINIVALRGFNDGEAGALTRFAWERGCVPRFIEWMPMSDGALYGPGSLWPAADIRATLERELGVRLVSTSSTVPGSGPARYWRAEPGGNEVGLITAMTEHFCDACNRVRVSASGMLHACLAHDDAVDLKTPLRQGDQGAVARAIREALAVKRPGHEFTVTGGGAPKKHMVAIGG